MTGTDAITLIVLLTILIAIGVYLLHWLYRHSSKDQSFVRTGVGGERVVMGGGALIVPIVHDITRVSMNAMPVAIRRVGEHSLIARNKLRVDVAAEFLVRVMPTAEGVSTAARTLGERTRDPALMKEIVQGRFADALPVVAATMTMEEIHAERGRFMAEVGAIAARSLGSNGLELESASLIGLNQTDIAVFNPFNAFDAEGLTRLAEQIEERRRLRNRIENEARIEIKLKDFETESRALEIDRDLEYARIDQLRQIEARRSAQQAGIEEERASAAIIIEATRLRAEQEAERLRIAKGRLVDAERISIASEISSLEIKRQQATELSEIQARRTLDRQRIQSRREVEAERVSNEREVTELEVRARQEIALVETMAAAEVDQARLEREVEAVRLATEKAIAIQAVEKDKEVRVIGERAEAEQEKARILRRHDVDLERLRAEEEVAQAEIAKSPAVKLAETGAFRAVEDASIATSREIDELRIAARNYVETFALLRQREAEIVDKERLIAVINKSIEEAHAKTEAAQAWRAHAAAEDEVASAREEEIAGRRKRVELIAAASMTERAAERVVAAARAEKEANEFRAAAEIAAAHAAEVRYAKDAEGQRLLNESENMRSDASRRSAIYENLVRTLQSIIRETVKPMENIDSIKIIQVDGLPGLNGPSETGGGEAGGNMTDRVVNSAMKYRTQVAFVDGLLKDLGLPVESLGSAGGMSFRNFQAPEQAGAKPDKGRDD